MPIPLASGKKKVLKKCLVYAQNRLIFSDIELEKLDFRPDKIPDTWYNIFHDFWYRIEVVSYQAKNDEHPDM